MQHVRANRLLCNSSLTWDKADRPRCFLIPSPYLGIRGWGVGYASPEYLPQIALSEHLFYLPEASHLYFRNIWAIFQLKTQSSPK